MRRHDEDTIATEDGSWPDQDGGTVMVPLDGSTLALTALPVAEGLSQALGWVVHLLHVAEEPLSAGDLMQALHLTPERVRGRVLDQASGSPAQAISREMELHKARVIVMSTRAGQTPRQRTLGPVAEEVLRVSTVPVALVRPDGAPKEHWAPRRILLPHDGTPSTSAAIGPAIELARRTGAALDVLHVAVPQRGRPSELGTFAAPRYVDQPQHEWPSWANEFLTRLVELGHRAEKVRIRLELGCCDTADAIVDYANEHGCDLIVLVWRGRLDRPHASTIRGVVRTAHCPILVLRTTAGH